MSQLVPEVRVNKNGVAVTKHVRPDAGRPSDAASRAVPGPSVVSSSPGAIESAEERFDRASKANSGFIYDRQPKVIDDDGRQALADLIYDATKTDDEGEQRVGIATYVIRSGDALGARSMLLHQSRPKRRPEDADRNPFTVLDVWDRATDAGVLERNRLYDPEDPESSLYGFLIDFFVEAADGYDDLFPITETEQADLRQLAVIHEQRPDTDAVQLVEFFEERGEIDATLYLNAVEGAPAVRDGVL